MPDYSDDIGSHQRYQYWGSRLLALTELVEKPRADSPFWTRVKRRLRNRMECAGVFLTALTLVVTVIGIYLQSQDQVKKIVVSVDQTANGTSKVGWSD